VYRISLAIADGQLEQDQAALEVLVIVCVLSE
jgi:hypothetical protein